MRRLNRTILGLLLIATLVLAPAAFADESASDGWSLGEWIEHVLDGLFGGETSEEDDGVPDYGPAGDPVG